MDDLRKILNRPREYQNIDGVGELGMGFFALSYALLLWFQMHTPHTSSWHAFYGFLLCFVVVPAVIHFGSKAIKNHVTYRRTGYVEYRAGKQRWVVPAISFGTAMLISGGLAMAVRHHLSISTPYSLFGLIFAAGYIRLAQKMHWKWIVCLVMIAGLIAIALLPAGMLDSMADHSHFGSAISSQALGAFWLTWAVCGTLFLISGIATFGLYLRRTQPPAPENR